MDENIRATSDGTLYLADYPTEPGKEQEKSHGLLYYAVLFSLTIFVLVGMAVTALFVFFLILAFL